MLKRISLAVCILLIPATLFGAGKFMLFDVQGNVVLKSSGMTTKLGKNHLLKPVKEGDRIEVKDGKALFVSMLNKQGYEILKNSVAEVKDGEIKAVSGSISIREGLSAPGTAPSGPIGAIVLRNTAMEPCIMTVSPINTAVITTTPELKWNLLCSGAGKEVSVKVLDGRTVIYEASTDGNSAIVPEGILKYGITYRWLVDGGPYGIMGGSFSIPELEAVEAIKKKLDFYSKNRDDLTERLAFITYLLNNRLNENAGVELQSLKRDFPNNEYVKEIE